MIDSNLISKIENVIYIIRNERVIFDSDLAELYLVETRVLNQAVKRNIKRFPNDFMFQLNNAEFRDLKSQFVISSWGGRRKPPLAFTENGIAMLSGILSSDRAIAVNIQIMRTFTKLRRIISTNKEIGLKLELVIKTLNEHDGQIKSIYSVIEKLLEPTESDGKKIGFV